MMLQQTFMSSRRIGLLGSPVAMTQGGEVRVGWGERGPDRNLTRDKNAARGSCACAECTPAAASRQARRPAPEPRRSNNLVIITPCTEQAKVNICGAQVASGEYGAPGPGAGQSRPPPLVPAPTGADRALCNLALADQILNKTLILPAAVYSARAPRSPHCEPGRRALRVCVCALCAQCLTIHSIYTMIICLSGFVIAGTSPTSVPLSARNDIGLVERMGVSVGGCERMVGVGVGGARYSPHHQQLLAQFARAGGARGAGGARRAPAARRPSPCRRTASPPPALQPLHPLQAARTGAGGGGGGAARHARVRTLYACLGESDGELSFEPNQIITNVTASGEPGWLRGTLNGKTGLVPENYVEPLP
ncbi:unnamed protein product [Chrysodeixis includens]|uniref:SH3 domain-containing protein n=1 Tax=Chrysodeixis includens TaxID=689277 RepID=A0A9P0FSC2_CHRIL|nr:unnamed protein product [Chrysodeixis includens]